MRSNLARGWFWKRNVLGTDELLGRRWERTRRRGHGSDGSIMIVPSYFCSGQAGHDMSCLTVV